MFSTVKGLVESNNFTSLPPIYVFPKKPEDSMLSTAETVPIIDFSLLTSANDPDQRCKAIQDLGNACRDWGFFVLINHGVPEELRDEILRASCSFFELAEEEKREFAGNQVLDPIRCGSSFNVKVDKSFYWRDYLKLHVHPSFNAPNKPPGFSEVLQEYSEKTREVADELMKGVSKSLGLEADYILKRMNVESGSQLLVINLYPPCPQPEIAMGLPPHTDHGLLTLLIQNELCGLQVQHHGKWIPVNPHPNSFLVNLGDHMEILTNGEYKSVVHRAMVNKKATRISIGTAHGPSFETTVSPAPELVSESHPPAFRGIKYSEYLELQQKYQLETKSCLDRVRISTSEINNY
ncbi:putative 2-oxoglutarate and Fe(II)-dependent oxygenase superfamily protein [Quillaja saponaria]|uniref:2-oxoglutarate and Fe(II)-dependent oxygenase superfamily protein n=1 Tax=Quillaja saponaria TaxID=32244 RepID=A0AAD7LIU4_QUISA|nr:putative 2-oxoglutarate and Fe(II)-dependent oxygenase superfamily protein [Quillaja saponaria]